MRREKNYKEFLKFSVQKKKILLHLCKLLTFNEWINSNNCKKIMVSIILVSRGLVFIDLINRGKARRILKNIENNRFLNLKKILVNWN